MSYEVLLLPRAQRELADLPEDAYREVRSAILGLREDVRPHGCRKLRDREGWRLRVGHYRVIYEIDDGARTVLVMHVGHRRDIYR